jgi:hypothetical protein
MTPTAWLMAAAIVVLERVFPPGSLVSPKSTKLELAKLSTRATYVASVPVG